MDDPTDRIPDLPSLTEVEKHDRGKLPHWEVNNGVYFLTFRLADSLPSDLLEQWKSELGLLKSGKDSEHQSLNRSEERRLRELLSEKVQTHLDHGKGECHLHNPQIAELVSDSLMHFEGERYDQYAWTVMPNHAHTVFRPKDEYRMSDLVESWKRFTGRRANRELGRDGRFWQRGYFDRLIRDQADFLEKVRYTFRNPAEAGLEEWEFRWIRHDEWLND